MRRLLVAALLLTGCSSAPKPLPQPVVAPESRTIFYQGAGSTNALYSMCDKAKGNLIYFNTEGAFWVAIGGCPTGEP